MQRITVRSMEEKDVEAVAAIESRVFSEPWSAQAFADSLKLEETLFLVAEVSGKGDADAQREAEQAVFSCEGEGGRREIAGYIGMYISFEEAEITNVATAPEFRRQGVGKHLLEAALEKGRASGVSRFILEVRVSNRAAIALYEGYGFQKAGVRRDFYTNPREDAWLMDLRFIKKCEKQR